MKVSTAQRHLRATVLHEAGPLFDLPLLPVGKRVCRSGRFSQRSFCDFEFDIDGETLKRAGADFTLLAYFRLNSSHVNTNARMWTSRWTSSRRTLALDAERFIDTFVVLHSGLHRSGFEQPGCQARAPLGKGECIQGS